VISLPTLQQQGSVKQKIRKHSYENPEHCKPSKVCIFVGQHFQSIICFYGKAMNKTLRRYAHMYTRLDGALNRAFSIHAKTGAWSISANLPGTPSRPLSLPLKSSYAFYILRRASEHHSANLSSRRSLKSPTTMETSSLAHRVSMTAAITISAFQAGVYH